jgi:hypothetical protein
MPTINSQPPSPGSSSSGRPSNREVEQENQRTDSPDGQPPRPATEPPGAADSSQSPKTETDPGTGAS